MPSREDRKDEFLAFFNSKGFIPVLLPQAGLLPARRLRTGWRELRVVLGVLRSGPPGCC